MNAAGQDDDEPQVTETLHRVQHAAQNGKGMPVVLLHGFPLDHTMWNAQFETLGRQWRVIAPDLPGFGRSTVLGDTVSMEEMADEVASLLFEPPWEIREAIVVVGLSMGGYVAFEFWRKYRTRMRALVLCDTRSVADTPEAAEGRHKLAEQVLGEGTAPVADAMLPKLFGPYALEHHRDEVERIRQTILANSPQGVAAALRGMAVRQDMTSRLPKIALPTLVVVGQDDVISTVDEMRTLARAIPNSEFVVIPRSGHMTPVENPDEFNEALETFLTRVERGRPSA